MPSGRKSARVAMGEIAPKFLRFCFIASIMIFLLTLMAGFLSPLDAAEFIIFMITIFLSLCVMIGSAFAIRAVAKREKREKDEKEAKIRAERGGLSLNDWLEKQEKEKKESKGK